MQNDDLVGELLTRDHARLSARLVARPMDEVVLAQLEDRDRSRGLVLAGAAILGAAIAFADLLAFAPAGQFWSGIAELGFAVASLAIAGTIGALSRAMAE